MKTETPKEATDRKENETVDPPGSGEDDKVDGPKKPRLASIVREVEAAVRELEEPPRKD